MLPDFLQPIGTKVRYYGPHRGIIEQRCDPSRLYRVRVRVNGVHSQDAPTESLPWAWPKRNLSAKAGVMGVPPVGTWVWVEFEGGDHEYPVWSGAAWGDGQQLDGTGVNAHRNWATSGFGGSWSDGVLKTEKTNDSDGKDAPNNYGYVSPLQKRIELDDRKSRQKISLADALDNMLWINSEHASITIESVVGVRAKSMVRPRGLTLSSDPTIQTTQLYTFKGWLLTMCDLDDNRGFEITSPSGHQIRITDTIGQQRIDMWSRDGHRFVMDDTDRFCTIESKDGFGVRLDDANKYASMYTPKHTMYVHMDVEKRFMEVFSAENMNIKSSKDIRIQAEGDVAIDGRQVLLNSSNRRTTKPAVKGNNTRLSKPERRKKIKRACDYDYYLKP